MVQAIRFAKTGGPEVLEWQPVEVGKPGQGQVRLRHTAVGLNYIDTYQRSGLYPMPLPSGHRGGRAGRHRAQDRRPRCLCRRAARGL